MAGQNGRSGQTVRPDAAMADEHGYVYVTTHSRLEARRARGSSWRYLPATFQLRAVETSVSLLAHFVHYFSAISTVHDCSKLSNKSYTVSIARAVLAAALIALEVRSVSLDRPHIKLISLRPEQLYKHS